jgi:hypothetical protein
VQSRPSTVAWRKRSATRSRSASEVRKRDRRNADRLAIWTRGYRAARRQATAEAGLVTARVEAQRRVYALDMGPLAELDAWLEPYRRFWAHHLDALERHLDLAAAPATPDDNQEDEDDDQL